MTNSMIPYSFIPGTKAKASEVNANFVSLANYIEQNKSSAAADIEDVNETIDEISSTKADKTELINEFTVDESDTDLDNYKTKGTYIFSSVYTPTNIPKGNAGILIVTGLESSVIKQMWYTDEENPEIFTRNFESNEWEEWSSTTGKIDMENPGYLKLPNGLLLQWGGQTGSVATYPIAYTTLACPVITKQGYNASATRSDTGFTTQSLTGFSIGSSGSFTHMNWIVFGY